MIPLGLMAFLTTNTETGTTKELFKVDATLFFQLLNTVILIASFVIFLVILRWVIRNFFNNPPKGNSRNNQNEKMKIKDL